MKTMQWKIRHQVEDNVVYSWMSNWTWCHWILDIKLKTIWWKVGHQAEYDLRESYASHWKCDGQLDGVVMTYWASHRRKSKINTSLKKMCLDVGHHAENNMTKKLFPCVLGHFFAMPYISLYEKRVYSRLLSFISVWWSFGWI